MNTKQTIIDTALSQTSPFSTASIVSLSGASMASVNNTLSLLVEQGKIVANREGRKYIYSIIDGATNTQTTVIQEPLYTIAEKFNYIRNFVRMVIRGINPSALIVGRSGVGKTFLVKEELKDTDYLMVSGYSTAFGLYKLLYDNSDKFIVLDDCDAIYTDKKAVNILKAALDSYDTRKVSWYSEKTDDKEDIDPFFNFTGRIIFISNLYASQIDGAIRQRSICVDLHMSTEEVTEHMRNILPLLEKNVSMDIKTEVLDYMSSIANTFQTYGIRTLIQAIRTRIGADEGNDWKKMIQVMTCNS
jgi:hypothetical protein